MNSILYSKFLYHSLPEIISPEENEIIYLSSKPHQEEESVLDKYLQMKRHQFSRVFKWKFQDLNMILGSDLMVFDLGKDHPKVSLYLEPEREEKGNKSKSKSKSKSNQNLDRCLSYYWDNILSNIPEMVICKHSNGYIKNYQFFKIDKMFETDEFCPNISGFNLSKDSGQISEQIQKVAEDILVFLNNSIKDEFGTYLLQKNANSEDLEIYKLRVSNSEPNGLNNLTKNKKKNFNNSDNNSQNENGNGNNNRTKNNNYKNTQPKKNKNFDKLSSEINFPIALLCYKIGKKIIKSPQIYKNQAELEKARFLLNKFLEMIPTNEMIAIQIYAEKFLAESYELQYSEINNNNNKETTKKRN